MVEQGLDLHLTRVVDGFRDGVLLIDFVRFGDGQTLSDCLAGADLEVTVDRADPVSDLAESTRYRSLEDLAAGYVAATATAGLRPEVVVGFCSASRLALEIAAKLETVAAPVATLLVEPTWPDPVTIEVDLDAMHVRVGGTGRVQVPPEPDLAARLELMAQTLEQQMRLFVSDLPGDEADEVVSGLLGRYRAWLSFAMATVDAGPPTAPGTYLWSATGSVGTYPVPGSLLATLVDVLDRRGPGVPGPSTSHR